MNKVILPEITDDCAEDLRDMLLPSNIEDKIRVATQDLERVRDQAAIEERKMHIIPGSLSQIDGPAEDAVADEGGPLLAFALYPFYALMALPTITISENIINDWEYPENPGANLLKSSIGTLDKTLNFEAEDRESILENFGLEIGRTGNTIFCKFSFDLPWGVDPTNVVPFVVEKRPGPNLPDLRGFKLESKDISLGNVMVLGTSRPTARIPFDLSKQPEPGMGYEYLVAIDMGTDLLDSTEAVLRASVEASDSLNKVMRTRKWNSDVLAEVTMPNVKWADTTKKKIPFMAGMKSTSPQLPFSVEYAEIQIVKFEVDKDGARGKGEASATTRGMPPRKMSAHFTGNMLLMLVFDDNNPLLSFFTTEKDYAPALQT